MDPTAREQWQSEVLDAILESFAASGGLATCLIFKGARVLSRRLETPGRKSLDIDTNLDRRFTDAHPERSAQRDYLRGEVATALREHFGQQDPVRFELVNVNVELNPRQYHPRGWNAFLVSISVKDLAKPGVRGLPSLTVDVAAPEALKVGSVAPLSVGKYEVTAYTLPRIAGEKLRAFLTSLPAYRRKLDKPGEAVRAKDIYDLACIERERPLSDRSFWNAAGQEFRMASASRYVDCAGLMAFEEDLEVTRATYRADTTIPKDVSFEAAWAVLTGIVLLMEGFGVIPFAYALPPTIRSDRGID
jgi:hypothetical protein